MQKKPFLKFNVNLHASALILEKVHQMAFANTKNINKYANDYRNTDPELVAQIQLKKLNRIWCEAHQKIPFYIDLKDRIALPDQFASLDEYCDKMPILEKSTIKNYQNFFFFPEPKPNLYRITGGSTSNPIQIPAWKSEYKFTTPDTWVGRSWYGISPADRVFLYWGHSHLLGSGLRGKVNALSRKIKDRIQNYHRYSCYDLSDQSVEKAGLKILEVRPQYIIGYSYALDRLARVNRKLSENFKSLGIKAVIATAESLPFEDSASVLEEIFSAPLAMEYGAVETNVIAHAHPEGGYHVFWKNYFLEFDSAFSNTQEVIVSSLYDRCTPLFRYKIGDILLTENYRHLSGSRSLLSFDKVIGRSNVLITMPSGRQLHSEAVSHAVRSIKDVVAYQFECLKECVKLNLVTRKSLDRSEVEEIYEKARKIDPEFSESLKVCFVDSIERSISGKTPTVVIRT